MSEADDFNQGIIEEFRSNDGVVAGPFAGSPVAILTTTGAKSGRLRTNPLVYLPGEDGTVYLFASKGGAPTNPDWYHNLVANPVVTIEIGKERYEAEAEVLTGDERDARYERQAELFPNFAEYQQHTTRVIPVVAVRRKKT